MNKLKSISLILSVLLLAFATSYVLGAWTEPSASPPGGNVAAPINTGDTPQGKDADIWATGFRDSTGNYGIWPASASVENRLAGDLTVSGTTTASYFVGDGSQLTGVLTASGDYGRSGVSATLYEGTTALSSKYLQSETDPQVGTLTNTKWCTTDGSQVNCTSDSPLTTASDYGRSGVSATLYEGTTALSSKYAGISHAHAAADITSGTFGVARGGTGLSSIAAGGILYTSSANTLSRIAPSAANQVLRSTAANALTIGSLVAADIPNLDASKITSGTMATARLGSGTASSNTFLRGDQTWASVPTGITGSGTTGKITKWTTGGSVIGDSVITESSDNVGIGTTTPATTFQVYGTSTFTGGNVGIGTASPGKKLEVSGSAGYTSTGNMGGANTDFASKGYVDAKPGLSVIEARRDDTGAWVWVADFYAIGGTCHVYYTCMTDTSGNEWSRNLQGNVTKNGTVVGDLETYYNVTVGGWYLADNSGTAREYCVHCTPYVDLLAFTSKYESDSSACYYVLVGCVGSSCGSGYTYVTKDITCKNYVYNGLRAR